MTDMTREEAIKYFEKRKEKALMLMGASKADTPINNQVRGTLTRKIEALDMAISALSADVRPNIHARWESDGYGHIFCTACKGAKLNTHRSKFCDSCGAIMDAEVDPKAVQI